MFCKSPNSFFFVIFVYCVFGNTRQSEEMQYVHLTLSSNTKTIPKKYYLMVKNLQIKIYQFKKQLFSALNPYNFMQRFDLPL